MMTCRIIPRQTGIDREGASRDKMRLLKVESFSPSGGKVTAA
jgi:hypothetical protein